MWAPVEVDRSVRDLRDLLEDDERDWALRAWRAGDKLLELYNGFPERAKRHESFRAFVLSSFELTWTDTYELLRIRARLGSASEAQGLGREKLRLGFASTAARLNEALAVPKQETRTSRT